jgi:uncharacterized membrane protein
MLHFTKSIGWKARWPNKEGVKDNPQPGAVVLLGDVGEPYDDSEVDEVYAIVAWPDNSFAIGSWTHSRDEKTGKIDDNVVKYSVNPKTGEDRVETLTGPAALKWERELCRQSNIRIQPSSGQDSKACRSVLKTTPTAPPAHKQP